MAYRVRDVHRLLASVAAVALAAAGFLGLLVFPQAAGAASCKCFWVTQTYKSPLMFQVCSNNAAKNCYYDSDCGTGNRCIVAPYTDKYCKPNTFSTDCYPSRTGFPEQICNGYQCDIDVDCQAYRDDSCQEAVGTPIDSPFSKCWTEEQCNDSGGEWDRANQNESPCEAMGDVPTARCFVKPLPQTLQVAIPGLTTRLCSNELTKPCSSDSDCSQGGKCRPGLTGGFPQYLSKFYAFFVAALAVFAVTLITWGGFKRLMAAGSSERIKDANDVIFQAIIGLVLALISYSLLNLINPKLVTSVGLQIDKVKTRPFGSWCPDPAPDDPNKHYECGEKISIEGITCVGPACRAGLGCYKVTARDDDEVTGKSDDYKCLTPEQACTQTTGETIRDVHGVTGGDFYDYDTVCRRLASGGNDCYWRSGNPRGWSGGSCKWLTKSYIDSVCGTAGLTCDSFNNTNQENRMVFCEHDLCKQGCRYQGRGTAWRCL